MSSLLLVLLSSVLITTVVIAHLPQWRPFVTPSGVFDGARLLASVAVVALTFTAVSSWLLATFVLRPLDLQYLRTPAFVAIVLIVVPLTELALRRSGKVIPQRPGFALLMSTNTSMFGIALIADERARSMADAILLALGAASSFALLLSAFAALYDRMQSADVPEAFRDAPLALVTAGIVALAFMGLTGVIQE